MIFCDHCFNDSEIVTMICSNSASVTDRCPVCGSEGVHLYDTDSQDVLTPYFENLLSIYSPASSLREAHPEAEVRRLPDELDSRWKIFSPKTSMEQRNAILKSICSELYSDMPELFDGEVGIPELYDSRYLEEHALLKNNDWDSFVNEIKTVNRYHSKLINFEAFRRYCTFILKEHKAGELFYRARISEKVGYQPDEMSAPPPEKSSEGRANARGITCLYLASDIDTTLHEVRAGVFDYVSVGRFRLKENISLVDFRKITVISPFVENLDCLDYAINKQYLEKVNAEMSKTLRRSDSPLDYVPTQYIVDFIKSIEENGEQKYDGIEYNSTTNPDGYNLALFNPDLFECIDVDVYNIRNLQYDTEPPVCFSVTQERTTD